VKRTKKKKSPDGISVAARKNILSRLKNAQKDTETSRFDEIEDDGRPVFPVPENLEDTFRKELEAISGKFFKVKSKDEVPLVLNSILKERGLNSVFCTDETLIEELGDSVPIESAPERFNEMEAGVTRCEALVARTGSVVVSSYGSGRRMNVFPPVHIVIASYSRLVPFISDAFDLLKNKYGNSYPAQVTFVAGPSRTADIEKTLVMGAHGPRELIVIMIGDTL